MAQETAIEDYPTRNGRFWVAKVVTGNRRNMWVLAEEFRQAFSVQNRIVVRAMNRCESCTEFPAENRFDGRAAVLEYVVMDENKSRRRDFESVLNPHNLCI